MKTPSIIKDWLTEFKTLKECDESAYGSRLLARDDLFNRLTEFIEHCYAKDELDPVLSQIFNCFRHPNRDIYLFALQLVPSLIYIYLRNFTAWKDYGETIESLETCLLGMYNLVNTKLRTPTNTTATSMCSLSDFRIPSLTEPSIYHDGLAHPSLWSERDGHTSKIIRTGLQLSIERRITSENRFQVLTILQILYNDELASLTPNSLRYFLSCFQRVIALDAEPRIPLAHMHSSSQYIVQCLTALYFSLFNGNSPRGLGVLTTLEERAMYELMTEVLLVVNAIRNSLETNPSGQPEDGPMGIKAELASTPPSAREARARGHTKRFEKFRRFSTTKTPTVITNASFRTKKLPEDITVDEDSLGQNLNVGGTRPPSGIQVSGGNDVSANDTSSGVYVTASSIPDSSSPRTSSFLSTNSSGRKSDKQKGREVDDISIEMTKM